MDNREQIDWTCNECNFSWIGDNSDFSCPSCDEIDIKPKNKILD
ncbi:MULTISPECIES: rubrerythrin family protein [Bacillus subtilis group]|nr:rubrerythrin family protein [Bacillus halotolerans]MEC1665815.1 rubrerythrin family protein [Bacillus halotolerans]